MSSLSRPPARSRRCCRSRPCWPAVNSAPYFGSAARCYRPRGYRPRGLPPGGGRRAGPRAGRIPGRARPRAHRAWRPAQDASRPRGLESHPDRDRPGQLLGGQRGDGDQRRPGRRAADVDRRQPGSSLLGVGQIKDEWFDPARSRVDFVVLFPGITGYPGGFTDRRLVVATFGKPGRVYQVGRYKILWWPKNLLTSTFPRNRGPPGATSQRSGALRSPFAAQRSPLGSAVLRCLVQALRGASAARCKRCAVQALRASCCYLGELSGRLHHRPRPGVPATLALRYVADACSQLLISSDHFFAFLSILTTCAPEMSEFCGQN